MRVLLESRPVVQLHQLALGSVIELVNAINISPGPYIVVNPYQPSPPKSTAPSEVPLPPMPAPARLNGTEWGGVIVLDPKTGYLHHLGGPTQCIVFENATLVCNFGDGTEV